MVSKIASEFVSPISHIGSNMNPRTGLTCLLALGALGTLIYFLQKPSSSKPTPKSTPTPEVVFDLPKKSFPTFKPRLSVKKTSTSQPSSYCLALRHSNNIFHRMIGAFLPDYPPKKIDPIKVEFFRKIRHQLRSPV